MVEKLLTVIVPSYNMEEYLPKCLGSLLVDDRELLGKLDVIVVNDGSKDRTSEIAHRFKADYPSVFRVIDKPNGNYGSCINVAIPQAFGRFVRILDADDSYDTNAFERFLKKLSDFPAETDMVLGDYVCVNGLGCVIRQTRCDFIENERFSLDDLVTRNGSLQMHMLTYRTDILRGIGYHQSEGISYTDTEWCFYPGSHCKSVRYCSEPVYRYWVGRAGQTCEHAIFIQRRGMLERIFRRMAIAYATDGNSVAKGYQEWQLRRMALSVFNLYVGSASVSISEAAEFLHRVQDLIQEYPAVSRVTDACSIFSAMPIHYVRVVLRHPSWLTPIRYFLNLYYLARGCYHWFHHRGQFLLNRLHFV